MRLNNYCTPDPEVDTPDLEVAETVLGSHHCRMWQIGAIMHHRIVPKGRGQVGATKDILLDLIISGTSKIWQGTEHGSQKQVPNRPFFHGKVGCQDCFLQPNWEMGVLSTYISMAIFHLSLSVLLLATSCRLDLRITSGLPGCGSGFPHQWLVTAFVEPTKLITFRMPTQLQAAKHSEALAEREWALAKRSSGQEIGSIRR